MFVIKNKKNNIQVEMAVKKLAFNIFSAMFAVTIVLINWGSCCALRILRPFRMKSNLATNLMTRWMRVVDGGKRQIIEYIQIIINFMIGVFLSDYLLGYHIFLVQTIVTITYQLHLLSLNWAIDLPDYSAYLQESEAIKIVTILFYLVFGFIGLSTQISFTLDLISIFSYPFKAMRKFFEKSHNQLLNLKEVMVNILTIKKKYWVTCPYPEYLLNDTFKIVYICALPLVFYLIFLTKAYSVLMSTLIVLFKTIINIGANLAMFVEEIGRIACTLLGLEAQEETLCYNNKSFKEKCCSVKDKMKNVEWVSVFKWRKIRQTFEGCEGTAVCYDEPIDIAFMSIISTYEKMSVYFG